MKGRSFYIIMCMLVLAAIFTQAALAGPTAQPGPNPTEPFDSSQMAPPGSGSGEIDALQAAGAQIYYHSATGKVGFLSAPAGMPFSPPTDLPSDAAPEQAAWSFLAQYNGLFGLQDPANELAQTTASITADGRGVTRYQQLYQGVPVLAGELVVQTDAANNLLSINGEAAPDLELSVKPRLTAEQAAQKALAATARNYRLEETALHASQPELVVYAPMLLDAKDSSPSRLAWRTTVRRLDLGPVREFVLVDAQLGVIALRFNQIDAAMYRMIYDNNNDETKGLPGGTPLGTPSRIEGGSGSGLPDDVNLAYDYLGSTYNFFLNEHGRDSIDGKGMKLVATTRFCPDFLNCPYQNAFWNGSQMVFGDGFASADDVVGHELAHGVTEHEAGLFYYMQSGAINEHFSDVWGEFIDLTNGLGDDGPGVRWLMGEDLTIGAIRDMSDPTAFGDPDRMQSSNYYCGAGDNGGVHWNSGVGNKAAYLMVDGGVFNGVTVTGIGIPKTADIYYETQTNLLTSGSDYPDLGAALYQACQALVGVGGITMSNCAQVSTAVNAVEMLQQPLACPATEAPPACISGSPFPLFQDDFENPVSGNWTRFQSPAAAYPWFYPQNENGFDFDARYGSSGAYNMWGYDQQGASDIRIAMTRDVAIPANAYMKFSNAWDFDTFAAVNYDGGVVEYSNNGGSTWNDTGGFFTANGYNGLISAVENNPVSNRQGFVQDSDGRRTTLMNLGALAGQNVRFRYRIGAGDNVDALGWFIDDVMIYRCANTTPEIWLPFVTRSGGPVGNHHSAFNGDAQGWAPVNGAWTSTPISYVTQGVGNQFASAYFQDTYNNVTVTARVKRDGVNCTSPSNCGNYIVLRGTPTPTGADSRWLNGYVFGFREGQYTVFEIVNGTISTKQSWTSTSSVNPNEMNNILSATAIGSSLSYSINGIPVWSGSDGSLSSGKVGLMTFTDTSPWNRFSVDWLSIWGTGP